MSGTDSSAFHVHLLPPHRSSPLAGCLVDRYSLRVQKWHNDLGGWFDVKPCDRPAGTRTECAAGSLNCSIFSANMVSIFDSQVRNSLTLVKSSG